MAKGRQNGLARHYKVPLFKASTPLRVEEKRPMVETIVWRKKHWIGHVMKGAITYNHRLMKEIMK